MFIDFINQTIYGDKGVYLSHFDIDKEVTQRMKYVAFKMYVDINEYHNKLGYDVNTIQEEYPILDEIVQYVIEYYNSQDNYNEYIRLDDNPDAPSYYYDKLKRYWVINFYKEIASDEL